tara:strand:+ start:798 stop:1040 length:243 start_codon:yes stop_codon:yes gene_type:complete
MHTPPIEPLGQVLPVFFSTFEMEEYRDACEAVYGKLRNVIDEDATMDEEYRRKLMRNLDSVWDLSARLNLAVATERMNDG